MMRLETNENYRYFETIGLALNPHTLEQLGTEVKDNLVNHQAFHIIRELAATKVPDLFEPLVYFAYIPPSYTDIYFDTHQDMYHYFLNQIVTCESCSTEQAAEILLYLLYTGSTQLVNSYAIPLLDIPEHWSLKTSKEYTTHFSKLYDALLLEDISEFHSNILDYQPYTQSNLIMETYYLNLGESFKYTISDIRKYVAYTFGFSLLEMPESQLPDYYAYVDKVLVNAALDLHAVYIGRDRSIPENIVEQPSLIDYFQLS